MWNWAKQQLANVAGTQEPIYGPEAILSVEKQTDETPYTVLARDQLRWAEQATTSVETQTFYVVTSDGHIGMAQIIYSNVAGLHVTAQFNTKVLFHAREKAPLWASDPIPSWSFGEDKTSFLSDQCQVRLSDESDSYSIKSSLNQSSKVDLKVVRLAPGFVAGKDGTSYFGPDQQNPWGSMRHAFWPRCKVEGTITTSSGVIDLTGLGSFVHALQGMKPHHAAARWNFASFHAPTHSAILMEYTTPPSYGSTVVNVGGLVTDNEIIFAGSSNKAEQTSTRPDEDVGWSEPVAAHYHLEGTTKEGKKAVVDLQGDLGSRLDRVDVMAEVPNFVKQIVAGAAGTKPYIYQFGPNLPIIITIDGEEMREEGRLFAEATFIS